jgi:oligopeptide/dipeptide ABC transporter ATP-binding protein
MSAMIELVEVVKDYSLRRRSGGEARLRALDHINLRIEAGSTFGLVGESGSGKSTLTKVVLALEAPTSGTISVAGDNPSTQSRTQLRAWRRHVQAIFQDPYASLAPHLTVEQILTEPRRIHRLEEHETISPADLLSEVGLGRAHLNRRSRELSGGQRQRVSIAQALALRPSLVVCDEPTSALDVSVQANVLRLLKTLQRDHALTYLFVSHDLAVVHAMADEIGALHQGRLIESGTADTVFRAPSHHYTAALLAAHPGLTNEAIRTSASRRLDIALPTRGSVGCAYRGQCEAATPICHTETPTLIPATDLSACACHHPIER